MIGGSVFKELDNILARQVREDEGLPDFPDGASELECLRLVFRDRRQPTRRRWQALELAAKLATPRLSAVATIPLREGFAEQLDAAIKRSDAFRLIDVTPKR